MRPLQSASREAAAKEQPLLFILNKIVTSGASGRFDELGGLGGRQPSEKQHPEQDGVDTVEPLGVGAEAAGGAGVTLGNNCASAPAADDSLDDSEDSPELY